MKKKFNETGLCVTNKHYMVDTTQQQQETIALIKDGEYFIINRPRQFGKTTSLALLETTPLLDDYIVLSLSFEDTDESDFATVKDLIEMITEKIDDSLSEKEIDFDISQYSCPENCKLRLLSKNIKKIISSLDKKVVLMIDEVDQASNNKMFLKFLGVLRELFLKDKENTFHSVVLAGLHDVKNLKLKLRPNEETSYNSPWNIAISYDVDMTFSAKQIETMLVEYVAATDKSDSSPKMDIAYIAEKLYYHTSGYPYFVSKICKIIDEKIKPERWEEIDIIEAIKILLDEDNNPNFDKIIKILEEDEKMFSLAERVVVGNEILKYDAKVANINKGKMHGLFRGNKNNHLSIFNKIYDEMLTSYILTTRAVEGKKEDIIQGDYLKEDGKLDLTILLTKFKDAVKEKYSSAKSLKSKEFLEDDLRMLFFMYLKPILNGVGFSCKEVETCEERRMDVVIFFRGEKFIIELKIWRGEKKHKAGLKQLKEYMKYENVEKGYMLIMSKNKTKDFKTTNEDGIFTAWV